MDQTGYYSVASGSKGFRLCRLCHLVQTSEASCQPPWYIFLIKMCCFMAELEDSEAQNLRFQGAEESLIDKDV